MCWVCNAKRSYAEVAGSASTSALGPEHPQGASRGNSVNAQLAELAQILGTAVPSSPMKTEEGTVAPPTSPSTTGGEDRATLVQKLKQVESALSYLPDAPDFKEVRSPLMLQADALKRRISATKPMNDRLVGCRGALDRARTRKVAADNGLAVASKAQEVAVADVKRLETELAELEVAAAADSESASKATSLQRLEIDMKKVVQEMQTSGNVVELDIQQSMQQMDLLFRGLSAVAAKAQASQKHNTVLDMLGAFKQQPAVEQPQIDASMMPVPGSPQGHAISTAGNAVFPMAVGAAGGG